jgi:beta-1,4-mannosyl-glycoprotein beta-1,4-N-acetylglucosaminyltransferase
VPVSETHTWATIIVITLGTHPVQQTVRIYDTFLFDGELDLLDHRLRQNFDATDVFVLIEAAETYRGKSKPLVFAENRDRFAWAAHKIRAIELNSLGMRQSSPRARAAVQRNTLLMALQDATEWDVILILDADEIPSLTALAELYAHGLTKPCRLEMTRHYQRLNLLAPASTCCIDPGQPFAFAAAHPHPSSWSPGDLWSGRSGVAVPLHSLKGSQGTSPFQLRFGGGIDHVIPNAGRHLTAVDPSAHLARKLGRVLHAEWATERGVYPPHLERCEEHAVHHRGWWYAEFVPGKLPTDLANLAAACPAAMRSEALPSMWRRRCVRTWAWLRQSSWLSDPVVKHIDDHFCSLLPWLAAVLLPMDGLRFLSGEVLRRWQRKRRGVGT